MDQCKARFLSGCLSGQMRSRASHRGAEALRTSARASGPSEAELSHASATRSEALERARGFLGMDEGQARRGRS